jgi:undecaprenyl-diphosphatase
MPLLLVALLLGIVEGVTEFLPVSSTGHLILAARLLPAVGGPERAELFDVVIQSGAMLAVLGLYRHRFAAVLRPTREGAFGGRRGFLALAVGVLPALVAGYVLRHHVPSLRTPIVVASALAAGGVAILLVERLRGDRGTATVDTISLATALGVGLCQCLALVPGVSRSAATIVGGMLLGLSRRAAAEWSFLLGAPVLFAASAWQLVQHRALLGPDTWALLGVGLVAAWAAAVLAVRAFTGYLARATLTPFGWYRIALGALVLVLVAR